MADETNWITLTGSDLGEVLCLEVQQSQNETIGATAQPGAPLDPQQANRRDALLATVIAEVRGAIDAGGRIPISATPGTIPPEAKRHALNLVAFQMVASLPNLKMFIVFEGGTYSPSATLAKNAEAFILALRKGEQVTYPSNPEAESLAGTGGSAGDIVGTYDMTTN